MTTRTRRVLGPVTVVVLVAALATVPAEGSSSRSVARADPPYSGTVFVDPDILTADDPTIFEGLQYAGRGMRNMFDRRVDAFVEVNAYLFDAAYQDGRDAEVSVNPEFGSRAAARDQAKLYAPVLGQLPASLRRDVDAIWVQAGTELYGGGNRSILVHTGQTPEYVAGGWLEEVFAHEAAHTSLDADHALSRGWTAAQSADATFISTYARDNPTTEDVAESFVPYLALRYLRDRIDSGVARTFRDTIPHRLAYFDRLGLDNSLLAEHLRPLSVGTEDGWVRESSPVSDRGGQVTTAGPRIRVGDDARDREVRSVLSFDTAALPDRAVVTRVQLQLWPTGATGADPLGELRGLLVDVARDGFGSPGLRAGDFAARADRTVGPVTMTAGTPGFVVDLTDARLAVSRTGLTQLRLRLRRPDLQDGAADLWPLGSGDARAGLKPQLMVQYGTH